mgnify:CR=1 FL=1
MEGGVGVEVGRICAGGWEDERDGKEEEGGGGMGGVEGREGVLTRASRGAARCRWWGWEVERNGGGY